MEENNILMLNFLDYFDENYLIELKKYYSRKLYKK